MSSVLPEPPMRYAPLEWISVYMHLFDELYSFGIDWCSTKRPWTFMHWVVRLDSIWLYTSVATPDGRNQRSLKVVVVSVFVFVSSP